MKKAKPKYMILADQLAAQIVALPDRSPAHVLALFQAAAKDHKKMVICDAFWALDNCASWALDRNAWHPAIRALRNNPNFGPQLFALWG
jgi:hypothetical protein